MPHEYEIFKNAGAISIRIEATQQTRAERGELVGENDITETGLDDIKDWDYLVTNDSNYENLKTQIEKIISNLKNS